MGEEVRRAAKGLLNELNRYDPGWPHPESELHDAMKRLRAALILEETDGVLSSI